LFFVDARQAFGLTALSYCRINIIFQKYQIKELMLYQSRKTENL
jgi:hypothetical protein